MKNGWETIDLEPLTLQFVPWDVNSNVHFYGDAVEYVVLVFSVFYHSNYTRISLMIEHYSNTPTNTGTMRRLH